MDLNKLTYLSNLDILIKMTLPVLISVPPFIVPRLAKYFGPPMTVCFANSNTWLVTAFPNLIRGLTAMVLAVNWYALSSRLGQKASSSSYVKVNLYQYGWNHPVGLYFRIEPTDSFDTTQVKYLFLIPSIFGNFPKIP